MPRWNPSDPKLVVENPLRSYRCFLSNPLRATVEIDENLVLKAYDININRCRIWDMFDDKPYKDIILTHQRHDLDFSWAKACPAHQASGVRHWEVPL